MIQIRRSALVPYTPEQMFDLVHDVEAYPKRFRWCVAASVLERDGDSLVARLDLGFAGLHHNFTTRNVGKRPDSITMKLVEGPFRSMEGIWTFRLLGDSGCRVGLELDFDYASRLGGMALRLGFQGLANRMVDDFCATAVKAYG